MDGIYITSVQISELQYLCHRPIRLMKKIIIKRDWGTEF